MEEVLLLLVVVLVFGLNMKGGAVDSPTNSQHSSSNSTTRCPVSRVLCLNDVKSINDTISKIKRKKE
jgi:hypothetical protein